MAEQLKDLDYQKELFDRLRSNVNLKREEECFGACLKDPMWWLIEDPNPKLSDIIKISASACPRCATNRRSGPANACLKDLFSAVKSARKDRKLAKFVCRDHKHGFIYPITQGDALYGYLGACYATSEVSAEILDIFAAFTDTIVKEVQKELELSKLYETVRPRAIALSTVHTVYRLISSTLDINELIPRIARLSLQIIRANRCSIKLVDSTRKILLPKATVDLRAKKTKLKKVAVGRFAPGKAVKFGRPIRGVTYLATPLIDEDVVGVVTLYDKVDGKPFTTFDQEIMSTLAEQAVIAIKNAQLYKEQEKLTMGAIKALAAIFNARAPGTYMTRASFLRIAIVMGQNLHMNAAELKNLEYAVLLHDTGQLVIPEEVLSKPTKLTGRELELVKEHPSRGVEIIKHIGALKSVLPFILYHHENYDGSGYTKGLRKNQIPLGARIMGIVGAFEAMIIKKPYRVAKSVDDAVEEITKSSGTQFDPKVVEVFLAVTRRKDIRAMLQREEYEHR
jgi:HD-GYP domain-containing protein (c-di-GMP phosphodiesterase class II)